jgi:hypothetical protein
MEAHAYSPNYFEFRGKRIINLRPTMANLGTHYPRIKNKNKQVKKQTQKGSRGIDGLSGRVLILASIARIKTAKINK